MGSAKPYKGQKYQKIKKECIRKKTLFRDSEFPPEGPSLFYSKAAPADIVWKRPGVGIHAFTVFWGYEPHLQKGVLSFTTCSLSLDDNSIINQCNDGDWNLLVRAFWINSHFFDTNVHGNGMYMKNHAHMYSITPCTIKFYIKYMYIIEENQNYITIYLIYHIIYICKRYTCRQNTRNKI